MKNYASHNKMVFKSTLEDAKYRISRPLLTAKLRKIAVDMVDEIDGNLWNNDDTFPIWTSNLHDSTGLAVYDYGAITSFIPPQYAERAQSYGYNGYIKDIWGSQYLKDFINESAGKFSKGIWIVLFSAVPYAGLINAYGSPWERGEDFFGLLKEKFADIVYNKLTKHKV